ncbi:hypothetical protein LI140_02950 [Phocaeicola dorei]|uniref:hypothetical protein n=1 Tax=Phocaeicola dorei TaxID=357276 RepID=UPI001D07EDCC|nr:hypothetical protein [Phocaeicola dorei]MCB6461222.1 hypothetical protein [Phocaeicola dorei]MCB6746585.1 hypothetical protein [Phocaeicola dorei]MCB6772005.1 hypothetical protein [Phocaeicola dorei]MCB6790785.1 hypothetical protein [Phocaeicola dorei]
MKKLRIGVSNGLKGWATACQDGAADSISLTDSVAVMPGWIKKLATRLKMPLQEYALLL